MAKVPSHWQPLSIADDKLIRLVEEPKYKYVQARYFVGVDVYTFKRLPYASDEFPAVVYLYIMGPRFSVDRLQFEDTKHRKFAFGRGSLTKGVPRTQIQHGIAEGGKFDE